MFEKCIVKYRNNWSQCQQKTIHIGYHDILEDVNAAIDDGIAFFNYAGLDNEEMFQWFDGGEFPLTKLAWERYAYGNDVFLAGI